jgi:hypothetical protein
MWVPILDPYLIKVDKATVDTSNSMELSSRWIQTLEAWAGKLLQIKTKEYEIVETKVEKVLI